jgi:preprotein translocase subunit SecF
LSFGVSAVLAMLHDSLVLVGVFSFLGWWKGVEVDVLFVTALLTTLSFSVHDTIVVFDRIREMTRLHPSATLRDIADAAVLQTLGRSLNNSLTIIIMLVCLVWFGGSTIRVFGLALLIGAVTGTYSSTFTAVPLVVIWEEWRQQWQQRRVRSLTQK